MDYENVQVIDAASTDTKELLLVWLTRVDKIRVTRVK